MRRKAIGWMALLVAMLVAGAAEARRGGGKRSVGEGEKIDVNRAPIEELVRLPGIGRKRAEAIVALRTKRPFRRARELRRVRGIGKKTLQRLLPYVSVGAAEVRKKRR